jgi:hypothetical protein
MARVRVPYTLDLASQAVREVLVLKISYVIQEGDSSQAFFDETKAKQYAGLANQLFEHVNGNFSADCCFLGAAVFRKNPQYDSGHYHAHDWECSRRRTGSSFECDTGHCRASSYIADLIEHLHSIHSSDSRIRMTADMSFYWLGSWNHCICGSDHLGFRYNPVFRAIRDCVTSGLLL